MPTAMPPSSLHNRQQGFTLLELLIASIIFAIMAVMAYGGLDNVLSNSKASQQALSRLQQIQQGIAIISRDFSQLVPRAVRDEYGNIQPALSTANNIDNLVEFTRGGRPNPANLLRSTLVRVAYQFDDEELVRLQWPQLDNAPGMEANKTTLIDDLESVSIRYLDGNAQWQEEWPPVNTGASISNTISTQPLAIEVILTLADWGEIRRIYTMN
ncbi:MAG: type II secretion system minor pseudopilin GspJ [Gammaproteobacteria bacterium]|nr:type II secretion system minor pseudopilin GspJ [Gammaproteobacteria bacterium]